MTGQIIVLPGAVCDATVPISMNVSNIGPTTADFDWTDLGPGAQYRYTYKGFDPTPSAKVVTDVTTTSATITGLTICGVYRARVKGRCAAAPSIVTASATVAFNTTSFGGCRLGSFDAEIKVYPNPATNDVTINYAPWEAGTATIELVDLAGRSHQIIETELFDGMNAITLDVSDLPSGIYVANIYSNFEMETVKILVTK
jgi:hypothetical protein